VTSSVDTTDVLQKVTNEPGSDDATDEDEYFSISSESEDEEDIEAGGRLARQNERQRVLEAAGLIVKSDRQPPPKPPKRPKSSKVVRRRRPPPAAPNRDSIVSVTSDDISIKDPPPLPMSESADPETRLNDAFARYETFKMSRESNRLSIASSMDSGYPPPSVSPPPLLQRTESRETESTRHYLLHHFLGRKTPGNDEQRPKITISAPISGPMSAGPMSAGPMSTTTGTPPRDLSPAFGLVRS
jgi:hypothetical protein